MDTHYPWPQGYRCAVMVSVLFDDGRDAIAQAPDLVSRSKSLSVWQYGARRGVARLYQALAEQQIPGTWFVPVQVAERYADLMQQLPAAGQEIACRGIDFERLDRLPVAEQRALLLATRERLSALTGTPPLGFRLPAGRWPLGLADTLHRLGFAWSASLNGDDVPYSHPGGLVEIPVHLELEDRPYFQFNFTPAFPAGHSRLPSYQGVLDNWIREFDAYRRYGLCLVLQLRPEMTGTPARIGLVRALLAHMRRQPDVWFATGSQIAQWHQSLQRPHAAHHPLAVFEEYRHESLV